ncbi:hypothetical protein QCA50_015021 [Cerrena zonata]|uniref:Amino acid transporter n=1 Tax=Cerrena zonata TaxID=2478898 RepID=A0AAW0FPK4_9APHY
MSSRSSDVEGRVMTGTTVSAVGDADEVELARMGYKQELKRDLSLLQNFGVSFSIISVITGIPSLFLFGLNTGGPAVMVWGWVVVAVFHHACWPRDGRSWFNLLGQVAVTTGISFAVANFISTVATFQTDFVPSPKTTIGIYAAVLVSQGLINTFGVHLLRYLNNISVWWHAVGTTALIIAILAAAPSHQSAKFVFQTFIDNTGADGVGWSERASPAYVVVIGILMAQYTLTGFDASAHMTEETHNAAVAGPVGIIMAIGVSAVLGWFLILGLLFSIQDLDGTVGSATGQPVAQIFLDTVGDKGAIVLMVIVIGAMFFCGTFSITSNSRMMYAFARDGGIPGHSFFHKVDAKRQSPVRAVWLACTLSFILALPSLGSAVAFSAATSIATIGLYISYAIPILLRVVNRSSFVRGPFHLGPFSYPVAVLACLWIAFISIAFILPQVNPVNDQTLNYSIVAVGIVIAYSMGFWVVSARKWFTGPVNQLLVENGSSHVTTPEEVERVEATESEKEKERD